MPSPEECVRQRAIAVIEHYQRMEAATSRGFILQRDVDLAVMSVVTRFTQEIENQLQRLFVQLVLGNRTLPSVRPLVSFRSSAVLHDHLREGRGYADWLPYDKTLKRAKRYFSSGRPFTSINNSHHLDELQLIRNALVHDSSHSKNRFERNILARRSVPGYERTPTRYLRGLGTNTESRLEQHLKSATFAFSELVQ